MSAVRTHALASGATCHFVSPRIPFGFPYRVLVWGEGQPAPTQDEQAEMLGLALRLARELSQARFGDPERYMLIHNGRGARRRRTFHYHVIPVAGRGEKTLVYLWLFIKNVLHLAWLASRSLRHRLVRPAG